MSHPPETPPLCANGCDIFGTPATNNLCSKCYKDHLLKQEILGAKEKSTNHRMITVCCPEELASSADTLLYLAPDNGDNVNSKKRCLCCKKKIRLLGFPCRCGGMFCSMHRFPEEHSFDYKAVRRITSAKENPLVSSDKLEPRI